MTDVDNDIFDYFKKVFLRNLIGNLKLGRIKFLDKKLRNRYYPSSGFALADVSAKVEKAHK